MEGINVATLTNSAEATIQKTGGIRKCSSALTAFMSITKDMSTEQAVVVGLTVTGLTCAFGFAAHTFEKIGIAAAENNQPFNINFGVVNATLGKTSNAV